MDELRVVKAIPLAIFDSIFKIYNFFFLKKNCFKLYELHQVEVTRLKKEKEQEETGKKAVDQLEAGLKEMDETFRLSDIFRDVGAATYDNVSVFQTKR